MRFIVRHIYRIVKAPDGEFGNRQRCVIGSTASRRGEDANFEAKFTELWKTVDKVMKGLWKDYLNEREFIQVRERGSQIQH